MMSAIAELRDRIERPDGVRRIGQALWMLAEDRIEPAKLIWARVLLQPNGDDLLFRALQEASAIGTDGRLLPIPLAGFLASLWSSPPERAAAPSLIWTLPKGMSVAGIESDGYLRAAIDLITHANQSLTIISPYIEVRGVGHLQEAILAAVHRGVDARLLTHDLRVSSSASAALEDLRRETRSSKGSLAIYESDPGIFVHLKVVAVDSARAIVGSANVTHSGFAGNLELGVALGAEAALQIGCVIDAAIEGGALRTVFSNRSSGVPPRRL